MLTIVSDERQHLDVEIHGTDSALFDAYRTRPEEQYVSLGAGRASESPVSYDAPAVSVTTLYGR